MGASLRDTNERMLQSMTGYGTAVSASATNGETLARRVTVEIKSVNHRHLDLRWTGHHVPRAVEDQLTQQLRNDLHRGSITVNIAVDGAANQSTIDQDQAQRWFTQLTALAYRLGTPPPTLELVLAQPGVIAANHGSVDDSTVIDVLASALRALNASRAFEGAALEKDLRQRLATLKTIIDRIEPLAAAMGVRLHANLLERVSKVLHASQSSATSEPPLSGMLQISHEVAVSLDRCDISEELVRLRAHLQQFTHAMAGAGSGPVGRKLDFLVQELARELGTIAAKSMDVEISHLTVDAKSVLEKLREQVQNVE
jgi:uncharacterized protein (TIGR00255 family)